VAVIRDQPQPSPRPWRIYVRISMRGLIVLVVLIAVGLSWLVNSARTQRAAVAAVRKSGGSVVYEYERTISGKTPWPKWLTERIGIDYLENVCTVSLPAGGSDADMVHVGHLTHLEEVWLSGSSVTNAGLMHLEGLNDLWSINLAGTKVATTGVARLSDLRSLTYLNLRATSVGDDGLMKLKGLTKLTALVLDHTPVSDAGLAHLKGMIKLKFLLLEGTNVTDAGLTHLKGLSSLENLNLHGTKVTKAGMQELQQSLPMTRVTHEVYRAP
jgi:internalin A